MNYLNRRSRLLALFAFLLANYILSLIIARPYLSYGPTLDDPLAWAYTRIAFISTFGILIIVMGLFLLPFTTLIKSRVQLFTLPPVLLSGFQILLLLDIKIYEIFRFHINGLVINTLSTEGAGDSVQLGRKTVTTIILFLTTLLIFEWGTLWGLLRFFSRQPEKAIRRRVLRKGLILFFIFLLMTIAADKGIFAYANFQDMSGITRYQKLFPLYIPLFADETLERYLGLKKEGGLIMDQAPYNTRYSLLNYPAKGFQIEDNLKPVNMVWIVIESWRFDMMNEEITPYIKKFSEKTLVFENHYSGGNASRFGIFSLFYSIYGTYWHQFLAERRAPVFIDVLQHLGYDFKILSSTQLTYPEFRKTAFVNLPQDTIEDRLPGRGGPDRDPLIARRFEEFLKNHKEKRPFFSFMFLDSPHAPYRYPEEFAKFQPVIDEVNYFKIKKAYAQVDKGHPLFNRYRNAIFFTDSVVNEILSALQKNHLMDSTVILITGDHGEEFFETGYYGHNSTFSDFQVKVPFLIYIPEERPGKVIKLTSHIDVVPTMLSLMGSHMGPNLYSHGRSLLDKIENPYVVSSGWDTFSIIDPETRIVLSTEIYNAKTAEVRTDGYQFVEEARPVLAARSKELLEVTKNLSSFLK